MRLIRCLPLALVCGCYNVVPLADTAPTPGRDIVIELAEPIEFQVVGARLQNLVRTEGTYLENSADSLVLRAENLWSAAGVRHRALGARVAVARTNVAALHEKRVSPAKTTALIGVSAGVLGLLVYTVSPGGGGGTGGNDGGGVKPK